MANITIEIKAPELVEALNNLAQSFKVPAPVKVQRDVSNISDTEAVKPVKEETKKGADVVDDPSRYSMFQELREVAKELHKANDAKYKEVLYQFVDEGRKISAVEPADWAKAKKAMEEALQSLKEEDTDDFEDDVEEEEVKPQHTLQEVRAFAAKCKNKGVKVGALIKAISGETKLSSIPESKLDAFYSSLEEALKEVGD